LFFLGGFVVLMLLWMFLPRYLLVVGVGGLRDVRVYIALIVVKEFSRSSLRYSEDFERIALSITGRGGLGG